MVEGFHHTSRPLLSCPCCINGITRATRPALFTTLCSLASVPPHPASPSVTPVLHLQCPDPRHNSLHVHARSLHTGSTTSRRYDPPWTSSPAHWSSSPRHQPALAPMAFPWPFQVRRRLHFARPLGIQYRDTCLLFCWGGEGRS